MASTLTLIGCSSTTAVRPAPAVTISEYHPELPDPLVLEDEKFVVCPNEDPDSYLCMTPADAQKVSRNKMKTLEWSKDARAVIDFYSGSGSRAQ